MEFLPILIGGDLNGYSVARAFYEEYQIKPVVVAKVNTSAIMESTILEPLFIDTIDQDDKFVAHLITVYQKYKDHAQKLLLIGCYDGYVNLIIKHKEVLSKYFICPYIDSPFLNQLRFKDAFLQVCRTHHLDHPETILVTKDGMEKENTFSFPVVFKAADSVEFFQANIPNKKKAYILNSEAELKQALTDVYSDNFAGVMLLQEFIPGSDSNMRVLTCFSNPDGNVEFVQFGHVLLEEHTPGAIGNPAVILNEPINQACEKIIQFLEQTNYIGFSNFDMKYDPRDGKYKLFEINTRQGRSNYYVTGSGNNIAKMVVDGFVYKQKKERFISNKEGLFTILPKNLMLKYIQDEVLKSEVNRLYKEKKVANPYINPDEKSLKRKLYVFLNQINQYKKYKKYFRSE